jgi:hypothetical protein
MASKHLEWVVVAGLRDTQEWFIENPGRGAAGTHGMFGSGLMGRVVSGKT